jgi:hypothetical protein
MIYVRSAWSLIAAVFVSSVFVTAALPVDGAHAAPPKVRQVRQQARIREGVRSGDLNKREAVRLQAQQAHIQAKKVRAKSDGVVTPAEKRRIDHAQDRANRLIYRKKHNAKVPVAPPAPPAR